MKELLKKAYSAEHFKEDADKLTDMLISQMKNFQSNSEAKTINYKTPAEELKIWTEELKDTSATSFSELAENIFDNTVNFHSKGYMGHQVAVTLPITALTSAMLSYLNHCTTVFELGMAGNAMEKAVITRLAEKYGYGKGSTGIVTSGGSLGNLSALVTARTSSGISESDYGKLAIMVSSEAHYSVSRAAEIMGIKSENIISVPSNDDFTVRTDLLEALYNKAKSEGKFVFCVVGCAGTTSVGAYDNLEEIATFAEKHQIWFHVDGAHGGAVVFSEKYKHLIKGIEHSDSLIVDFHKMMMAPALSTAVIYNNRQRKMNEFSPKAVYLWQDQLSDEWYNSAKHTLECTKPATIIHTYAIMRLYGDEIYKEYVDTLYDLGKTFADMIKKNGNMELATQPESNIVCLRYLENDEEKTDALNRKISEYLLKDGTFYAVSTTIRGKFYLRVTLMNPMTDEDTLKSFLKKIEEAAVN